MTAGLPDRVQLLEVGPRDGLQNEKEPVPTEAKVAFILALLEAGHTEIEITSFVRPDVVPQLADAAAVCERLGPPPPGVTYTALVPNLRGLERALATGIIGRAAVFTAASETFNLRNVNASIETSIERFQPVAEGARSAGLALRGYVSTALGCPYEGRVEPQAVLAVVKRLIDLGCEEISIGDTIGAATPGDVERLLDVLLPQVEASLLNLHLHDTRGMAVANALVGLRRGIFRFDTSSGGLGGCPFAPGAAGNLATEDLLFALDGMGIATGLDLPAQRRASALLEPVVGHELPSRVFQAPSLDEEARQGS